MFDSDVEIIDATIKIPFGMVLYGCPMAGKSTFIKNLIINRDRLLSEKLDYIVYFYGVKSRTILELEADRTRRYHASSGGTAAVDDDSRNADIDIILVEGLPEDLSIYIKEGKKSCLIFDDLMDSISDSKQMVDLVTRKCQHQTVSWIITFQNAFHRGTERLSITRSAQYITLFNSPLDKTIPHILASRIMPESRRTFLEIFKEATLKPYSYLFCDGRQSTPDKIRLRADIFNPSYQVVYTPLSITAASANYHG